MKNQSDKRAPNMIDTNKEFPIGLIEIDTERRVLNCSASAEHILGWEPAQMIGKRLEFDWLEAADRQRVEAFWGRLLSGTLESGIIDYPIPQNADGTMHCEWHCSAFYNPHGELARVLCAVRDVTPRELSTSSDQDANQELAQLYRALSYLLTPHDLPALVEQITQAVVKEFGQVDCGVMLVDQRAATITRFKRGGSNEAHPRTVLKLSGQGLVPEAIRSAKTTYSPDVQDDPRYIIGDPNTRAELVVPLRINQRVIGVLDLQSQQVSAFSQQEIRIVETFAERAAYALENALLQAEAEKATNDLLLLNHLLSLASTSLQVEDVLRLVVKDLLSGLDASAAVALLYDTRLPAPLLYSLSSDQDSLVSLLVVDDLIRLQSYHSWLIVPNLREYPERHVLNLLAPSWSSGSCMLLPLHTPKHFLGLIVLRAEQEDFWEHQHISLGSSISFAVGQALDNCLLHKEVENKNVHLTSIVEQRTAQLSRANERMAAILNSSNDTLVVSTAEGAIRDTNPAFDRLFAYATDELFGQPITLLVDTPHQKMLTDALHLVAQEVSIQTLEVKARRKDGAIFDVEVVLSPIINVYDPLRGVVCNFRDITRYKEVERLKDRFISNVSHELRTPLTSVLLNANSLRTHYHRMSEDQRLKALMRLDEQAQVLHELIEDMLALARLDALLAMDELQPVNIHAMLQNVLDEISGRAVHKNIEITTTVSSQAFWVKGHELDISRIWRNLIDNAVKYTPASGRIHIQLCGLESTPNAIKVEFPEVRIHPRAPLPVGQYVVGQVEDSGLGIPAEDLDAVFIRFHRCYNAIKQQIPGTGLGLSLVKELLERYGGGIGVESELNKGSVFSFWLPTKEDTHD